MGYIGKHKEKKERNDDYETPIEAWTDIVKYFKKDDLIYDPFYFNGATLTHLKKLGYDNVYHKNEDAFKHRISEDAIILTNPPYRLKKKVLEYYNLKKRKIALLIPLETLERKYFLKCYENCQIIVPRKRYNFNKDGGGSVYFKACWFCWNLEKEIGTNKNLIWL